MSGAVSREDMRSARRFLFWAAVLSCAFVMAGGALGGALALIVVILDAVGVEA